jgi:amino acid adenylation domain-containing protein
MELVNKISEHLKNKKNKTAVVFGAEEITYEALNVKVNILASYLQEKEIRKGEIVTILLRPSIEFVVSILAVLKTGAAYIPISLNTPHERIKNIIRSSGSSLIIFKREKQTFFKKTECDILNFETLDFNKKCNDVTVQIQDTDLAYVLFTSGSTGQPKGVKISHKNLSYYSSWTKDFFKTTTNSKLPLTSDVSFAAAVSQLFMSLSSGETLHIVSNCLNNPEKLFKWYSKNPEFGFYCVPSVWSLAIDWFKKEKDKTTINPPKALFLSGEDISQHLIKETQKLFPEVPIWNLYGPTEAVANLSYKRILSEKKISIGSPLPNTRFYVITADNKVAEIGEQGVLYASSPGISSGYLSEKKLTKKTFFTYHSQKDGEVKVYDTGDIVLRVKKNEYKFLGRKDQQIKINGQRIEIGEIENTLTSHTSVSKSIVLFLEKRLVAYVKTESTTKSLIEELRSYLLKFLPSAALPEKWIFVDEFPKLANGKIDRNQLPVIGFSRPELANKLKQASTRDEEIMLGLFEKTLKIKGIGLQDNFFHLGGNSLKAVSLLIEIEEVFSQKLSFQLLFKKPTAESILESFSINKVSKSVTVISDKSIQEKEGLSVQQEALFFFLQANPRNTSYNIAYSIKLDGSIDVDRIAHALQNIISSNELFSSKVIIENGVPFFYKEKKNFQLVLETLEDLYHLEKELFIDNSIANLASIPFAFGSDLFKFKLYKVNTKKYVLGFVVNHLIFDGESLPNFISQLTHFYSSRETKNFNFPSLSFSEITQLRNDYKKTENYKKSLGFWKRYLKGVKAINGFPKIYLDKESTNFESGTILANIDSDFRKKLSQLSNKNNITINVLLLSAFATALHKIGNQEEYLIAVPFANRLSKAEQKSIGYLSNTLFIRSKFTANKKFDELTTQIKSDTIQLLDHQQIPLDELIKILRKEGVNLSLNAFETLFAYHQTDQYSSDSSELKIDAKEVENKNAKCELQFECFDNLDKIVLKVSYNKRTIDEAFALQFVRIMKQILNTVVRDFNSEIALIPKLWDSEKDAVLRNSLGSKVDFDTELTLFNLFKKACIQHHNLPAIHFYSTVLSYKQLMEKTALTVEHLKSLNLKIGHPVAIYMDHCPEMVIAKLALAALAIPYIPLDPTYPSKRISYILENADTNYVLTNSHESVVYLGENTQIIFINQVISNGKKAKDIIATATKRDLLYLIYTSGSTGNPKGVMVSNKGVANYLLWMKTLFDVSTSSKILAKTSISFDISVWELFLPLISGGTLFLKKRADIESPEQIASIIDKHKITIIQFVPSGLKLFSDANVFKPITSLENIFCGGEKMPTTLMNEVSKKFNGTLHNLYGPTEASVFMSHYKCIEGSKHYNVPIGRPIFNSSMYILDDNKKLVPRGIPGDLYIGGEILADGYWRDKIQTEQAFVSYINDKTSEVIYKTGDLGRMLPDGNFEFHGRNDTQIKIRGYRVELGEIEAAIYTHPEIREVVAYKNILNLDDERLNAIIVSNSTVNIGALKKTLNSVLPKYMIPSFIHQVDEVPKLPNGKINFKVLQENTKPNTQIKKQVESEIEASIFKIWTEVIGHENFSLTDNFFDAGGHSVLFLKVKERLETMFGMDFSIIELYQYPNIKSIADEYRKRYANVISDKAKTIRNRTQLKKQSFGRSRRK